MSYLCPCRPSRRKATKSAPKVRYSAKEGSSFEEDGTITFTAGKTTPPASIDSGDDIMSVIGSDNGAIATTKASIPSSKPTLRKRPDADLSGRGGSRMFSSGSFMPGSESTQIHQQSSMMINSMVDLAANAPLAPTTTTVDENELWSDGAADAAAKTTTTNIDYVEGTSVEEEEAAEVEVEEEKEEEEEVPIARFGSLSLHLDGPSPSMRRRKLPTEAFKEAKQQQQGEQQPQGETEEEAAEEKESKKKRLEQDEEDGNAVFFGVSPSSTSSPRGLGRRGSILRMSPTAETIVHGRTAAPHNSSISASQFSKWTDWINHKEGVDLAGNDHRAPDPTSGLRSILKTGRRLRRRDSVARINEFRRAVAKEQKTHSNGGGGVSSRARRQSTASSGRPSLGSLSEGSEMFNESTGSVSSSGSGSHGGMRRQSNSGQLMRRLSRRASVKAILNRRVMTKFDDAVVVEVLEGISADDRRSDPTWARLTNEDKLFIRNELNAFKMREMDVHTDSRHMVRLHDIEPRFAGYIDRVGTRCVVQGYPSKGTLAYYGPHHCRPGPRCGVVLDKAVGKNNGTVGGHEYFSCEPKHGVLCDPAKVKFFKLNDEEKAEQERRRDARLASEAAAAAAEEGDGEEARSEQNLKEETTVDATSSAIEAAGVSTTATSDNDGVRISGIDGVGGDGGGGGGTDIAVNEEFVDLDPRTRASPLPTPGLDYSGGALAKNTFFAEEEEDGSSTNSSSRAPPPPPEEKVEEEEEEEEETFGFYFEGEANLDNPAPY